MHIWRFKKVVGIIILLIGFTIYLYWNLTESGYVSGTDGGNWLALGSGLWGSSVRTAETFYPPVVPALTEILAKVAGDSGALSVVALFSYLSIIIPCFFLMKKNASIFFIVTACVSLLTLPLSSEILAWGGYPQLLSHTFLLLYAYMYTRSIQSESSWKSVFMGSFSAALAIGCWIPSLGMICLITVITSVVQIMWLSGNVVSISRATAKYLFLTFLMSIPFIFSYWWSKEVYFNHSWNQQGFSLSDALDFIPIVLRGLPDNVFVSLLLLLMILLVNVWVFIQGKKYEELLPMFTIALSSLLLFLITQELRALSLMLICNVMGIFLWFSKTMSLRGPQNRLGLPTINTVLKLFVLFLIAMQVKNFHEVSSNQFSYYRIMNQEVRHAFEWLGQETKQEQVVISLGNRNGLPIIWWLEGHYGVKVYSAADIRFFNFDSEKRHVKIAQNYLEGESEDRSFEFIVSGRPIEESGEYEIIKNYHSVFINSEIQIYRLNE